MSKATKVRMIPTLLVVAVLGGAWMVIRPPFTDRNQPNRTVEVVVTFEPDSRSGCPFLAGGSLTDVVTVTIMVASSVHDKERICEIGRWLFQVPVGRVVDVRAEQFVGDSVTCKITQVGREPVTKSGKRNAHCHYQVV